MPCARCGVRSSGAEWRRVGDETPEIQAAHPQARSWQGGLWLMFCEACLLWERLLEARRWRELAPLRGSREREDALNAIRRAVTVGPRHQQVEPEGWPQGPAQGATSWHQGPAQGATTWHQGPAQGATTYLVQPSVHQERRGGRPPRPATQPVEPWRGFGDDSDDSIPEGGWGRYRQGAATAVMEAEGALLPPPPGLPRAARVVVTTVPPAPPPAEDPPTGATEGAAPHTMPGAAFLGPELPEQPPPAKAPPASLWPMPGQASSSAGNPEPPELPTYLPSWAKGGPEHPPPK